MHSPLKPHSYKKHTDFQYRFDIEGMRAIAVFLVILCHASSTILSGGFIGVDIFFVISGYVVTKNIAPAIESGSFSFLNFYGKRCKRLIPSLAIVCSFTFAYALFFNIPEFLRFTVKNIAFIFGFISNVFQAGNTGYFATESRSIPLLHIWSLSIEEQFYLLLPALIFFSRKKLRRTSLASIFIFSLLLAEYLYQKNPGTSYFSFPARIFEFIPGVVVALLEKRLKPFNYSPYNQLISTISLGIIIVCAITFNQHTPFPSIYTLLPVLASATLIFFSKPNNSLHSALSSPLLTHLGKLSYCLYLWHWPIFVILLKAGCSTNQLLYIGIPTIYVLSLLTSLFIETPIRNKEMPAKKAILYFTILPFLISITTLSIGKNTGNFQFLYGDTTQLISKTGRDTAWEDQRTEKCWVQLEFKINQDCMLGDIKSKKLGILWGDSHAYHLIDFIDILGKKLHVKFMDHAFSMCPPVSKMISFSPDPSIAQNDKQCNQHNINALNVILQDNTINVIAISATWVTYDGGTENKKNIHGFYKGQFRKQFYETVQKLTESGKKVIIFNDIPYIKEEYIDCALKNSLPLSRKLQCSYPTSMLDTHQISIANYLDSIASNNSKVIVVDTFHALCAFGTCAINYKGLPLYKNGDYGHLNRYGSQSLFDIVLKHDPQVLYKLDRFLKTSS